MTNQSLEKSVHSTSKKMKYKEIVRALNKAEEDPEYLGSDKYIQAQMERIGLFSMVLQMGPNCNLSCPHCYGSFSKKRKGLPKLKTVQNTLEEAIELGIWEVCLSDGEPIRH